MGFLEDLKRRLTTPGAEAFSRERFRASRPEYLEGQPAGSQTTDITPPTFFDAAEAARRRRRRILYGLGILGAILLIAGGTYGGVRWYRESRTVQAHHVRFLVSGPERVISGEDARIQLHVENGSRVPWENVAVELRIPQGFTSKTISPLPAGSPSGGAKSAAPIPTEGTFVWALGALPPRAAEDITITGRLLGEEGTATLFNAKITLTPGNRPGTSVEKAAFGSVSLAGIPVDLSIDVPRAAASGTPLTVRVVYQNRTTSDLTGARLVVETPSGFSVSSTTPEIRGRQLVWDLSPLPPQQRGEISIAGSIEGQPETAKPFTAKVGFVTPDGRFVVQRTVQRSLSIERAAFSLTQVLNTERDLLKVNPGAEIEGAVQYKNTGTAGLREVIVRLGFEGIGLDAGSVKVEGGFFDSRQKQITWSAASSPPLRVLRPGDAGELKFKFRMSPLEALPFTSQTDQNFSLITRATGDSPDIPTPPGAPKQVATDRFEILLNTVPKITLDAFYDDGRAGIPKSQGPLPPQVGQETILTVRARLTNTTNEIIDATYKTVLPEGVRWVGSEYHTVGQIRFNDRTRDVVWTIPLIPARAGVALPEPDFAFQVGMTPSLNQVGQEVALTRGHTLEGTDAFTTTRVRAEGDAVTTRHADPKKAEVVR
ncbi:MAG: Uncharacterized protein G01um101438_472 [Parcubacteria group bacterium Gr01-1014_38]|nr:MAG: Uncharacterized protein G01um101438_472 [Parcubacteria group bacterium Gr01-1014_38]